MKRVDVLLGLSLSILIVSNAFASVESTPLYNKQYLWHEIERAVAIKPQSEVTANRSNLGDNIQYRLTKSVGTTSVYQHYQAFYGAFPILDSNLVIARNADGSIRQTMGKWIKGVVAKLPTEYHSMTTSALQQVVQQMEIVRNAQRVETQKAYVLQDKQLLPVIQIEAWFKDRHETLILSAIDLKVISQYDNTQYAFTSSPLSNSGYQVGGGIGGSFKLGAVCYSPSPNSMQNCTRYQFDDTSPVGKELLFEDLDADAIFAEFNGYPYVIKKSQQRCILENPYVTTFDAKISETEPVSYLCQNNNENYDKAEIDSTYGTYYSYSAANEAHFNAGLVMQFFHKNLRKIFPAQVQDCSDTGYCIKPLLQKVNKHTILGSNYASWDGTYANYGPGNGGYEFYSLTGLGIVAHEAAHAITQWNSSLGNGDIDRAINEGMSDIAAIAALDYYQHASSGSYTQSQPFLDLFFEQPGQYTNNRKWWYGWDVMAADLPARYFELPSWDGRSIDHWKDFTSTKTGHDNGGVLRKAFYELVKTHGWSIQDAYSLFLRANAAQCLFSGISINEFGYCLLDQTEHMTVADKPASAIAANVSDSLAGVGISTGIGLSTLDADTWLNYNTVNYDLSRLDSNTISQIDIFWGDGQVEKWRRSDNTAIYPFLKRKKVVTEDKLMRFSIDVTTIDGTSRSAFNHFFSRKAQSCAPYTNSDLLHSTSLSFGGHQINDLPAGYTAQLAAPRALAKNRDYVLNFSQDLTGKLVSVFFDYNKNGLIESEEEVLRNQKITGDSVSFKVSQKATSGMGVLRIAITTNEFDYYIWDGCGVVDNGQVLDVMLDIDSKNLPIISDFEIQPLDNNRVKFINTSQLNVDKSAQYLWRFGFDNKTSTEKDPSIVSYPSAGGTFNVSLEVRYADNSESDTKFDQITLSKVDECPAKISNSANAGVFFIDEIKLFRYSTELATLTNAQGHNPQGYSKFIASNFEAEQRSNLSVEIATNLIPRSTAERLLENANRGVRFTIWLDKDSDGKFVESESSFDNDPNYSYWLDNSECRSISGSEYCRIKATKSISLPRVSWLEWSKDFYIRAKLEEYPAENTYKKDSCSLFDYGEIHDFRIKVKY
ncbi:M4 family metallopeptidase [Pseudoalteromonas obscura]|uniref:M4 family metallopeptidase n=1 Tax=Pseudoalteromonas obscura TaxID=3048491 RepID=A0ABT7ESV3_9GAMM|nr:M4 family metallopeptidase [Pseudoalteromonas sp. P94(2023)]MDK2598137.1 M4 family metallopeptidase [Pseudoalteromonas sp. P94(2023)]